MALDSEQPSVFLPPIKQLRLCSKHQISESILRLRRIYLPEVRGSTRRRYSDQKPLLAGQVVGQNENERSSRYLENIRSDAFERSFAIQWLTRLISIFSDATDGTGSQSQVDSNLLEEAASLLAICAGVAASGAVTRTFTFSLPRLSFNLELKKSMNTGESPSDGSTRDITVVLRDAPLESSDFTSVGAQTWGGSCILSEMIVENPKQFQIRPRNAGNRESFRALELGAGTGLASLVLGKTLERLRPCERVSSGQDPDVLVSTDFHPSVLANLQVNVDANFPGQGPDLVNLSDCKHAESHVLSTPRVSVLRLDWSSLYNVSHSHTESHGGSLSTRSLDMPISGLDSISYSRPQTSQHLQKSSLTTRANSQPPSTPSDYDDVPTSNSHPPLFPPLEKPFDLIIGADIIYEDLHARWVRSCVERLLKQRSRPLSQSELLAFQSLDYDHLEPLFHLIIPLRRTHAKESESIEVVFPRAADIVASRHDEESLDCNALSGGVQHPSGEQPLEMAIITQEDIVCDAYTDREEAEEVIYRYYRIGWV